VSAQAIAQQEKLDFDEGQVDDGEDGIDNGTEFENGEPMDGRMMNNGQAQDQQLVAA